MSRLLFNHSGIAADPFGHLLGLSRLLSGDVIEGMQVQAKASPAMSITVGQGSAGITTGTYPDSFRYWIANDTTTGSPAGESVTITTASASNPRIDAIVAYVNESATFSTSPVNQPGGWTAAAVAGTPSSTPAAPSASAIQAAIGAGNPYIVLATVAVGTSVTQINNGNITDARTFASVGAQNISSSAIALGYAQLVSTFTTTSTSQVQITGASAAVTIPSGNRKIKITVFSTSAASTVSTAITVLTIWDGPVGTGTQIGQANINNGTNTNQFGMAIAVVNPPAGSKTYNAGIASTAAGTTSFSGTTTSPGFILVEAI